MNSGAWTDEGEEDGDGEDNGADEEEMNRSQEVKVMPTKNRELEIEDLTPNAHHADSSALTDPGGKARYLMISTQSSITTMHTVSTQQCIVS